MTEERRRCKCHDVAMTRSVYSNGGWICTIKNREKAGRWRERNVESDIARCRAWRHKNADLMRDIVRAWKLKHMGQPGGRLDTLEKILRR